MFKDKGQLDSGIYLVNYSAPHSIKSMGTSHRTRVTKCDFTCKLPTTLDQQKGMGRSGSPITLSCTNIVKSNLSCST
jgi:hypothetical protein